MIPEEATDKNNLERHAALHCLNFGDKFIRERSWENAIIWLKQAITIQPDLYEAFYLLGEAYIELGRLEEAVETLNRAIQLRPKDPTAHFKIGLAYISCHDWNAALGQYRTLRTLDKIVAKQLFDKILFSFNYEMFDNLFTQIY